MDRDECHLFACFFFVSHERFRSTIHSMGITEGFPQPLLGAITTGHMFSFFQRCSKWASLKNSTNQQMGCSFLPLAGHLRGGKGSTQLLVLSSELKDMENEERGPRDLRISPPQFRFGVSSPFLGLVGHVSGKQEIRPATSFLAHPLRKRDFVLIGCSTGLASK